MTNDNDSNLDTALDDAEKASGCGGACKLPSSTVRIEHRADGSFVAHGPYGQELEYTTSEDAEHHFFSPVDLMKMALGECSSYSVERILKNKKGRDVPFEIMVGGAFDEENDRVNDFSLTVSITDPEISISERQELEKAIEKEIEVDCTVAHTYMRATPVNVRVIF